MHVLVTGGAGFLGSHVCESLGREGLTVVAVDNLSTGSPRNLAAAATNLELADITSRDRLRELFARYRPAAVVHCAAQVGVAASWRDPEKTCAVNSRGTLDVLQCCAEFGARRLVFLSSAAVYGNPRRVPVTERYSMRPLSPYGASKVAGEAYVMAFGATLGIEYVILRLSNIYGPRQRAELEGGVVAGFISAMLRGERVWIDGDGQQTRDFLYAGDAARAVALSLTRGRNVVLNISSDTETSVNELLALLKGITGYRGEATRRAPRPGDIARSRLSNKRALAALGWRPETDLPVGLRLTVADFASRVGKQDSAGFGS